MGNWKEYWESHPKTVGETDFLKQVGKTVGGQPISDQQFQLIVSDVCHLLDLRETDAVLDLCCGNGLITKQIAKMCKEVVGVDYSQPLLDVANRYHRPENVSYWYTSVLDLDRTCIPSLGPFNKVLMYEGLQHFEKRDLNRILRRISSLTCEGAVMLLGSVPDGRRKWRFYNTPQRRLAYLFRQITNRDAIGTWWDENFIKAACNQLELQCEFHEQSKGLHTSHYRFDVKIF